MEKREHRRWKTEIALTVFGLVFGTVFGGIISFFSYREAIKQTELSQINSSPYFEISAVMDGDKQTGYVIENSGGYIQSANVTLKSVINTYVRNFGGDDFYFEFETLSKSYADLKDTDIVLDFHSGHFGMGNWEDWDQSLAGKLSNKLGDRDIRAAIYYLEFLELQYLDKNRGQHSEQYMIGIDESGKMLLWPVPPEFMAIADQINIDFSKDIDTYEKDFKKQVGTSGGGGASRWFGHEDAFVQNIVEILEAYIAEFNA